MTRSKWYSPQLSREIVSRLYHKAKVEGIPMTRLANRIMQQALDKEEVIRWQLSRDAASPIAPLGDNGQRRVETAATASRSRPV
jgi:post-segregation antitoxin (ccd killing protein)